MSEQSEKVCKGLETIAYNMPKIISWQYDDMLQNTVGTIECAIALIRQQQERIAELEANRDAVASKTSDLVGYLANLVTTTKYFHGDHVDIPLDVYAECVFRLNKYYKRCEELEAAQKQEPALLENQHKPYGHFINANSPWISRCPKCGKKVEGKQTRYCKYCGQAVKWE